MAVRNLVGAVVHRLPYSERIPESVKSLLDENSPQATPVPEEEPEASPANKIRLRMMKKRTLAGPQSASSLTKMDSYVDAESETFEDTWKPARQEPNPMTEKYLNEQNEEFNSLINRNLKEVMQQQNAYAEDPGWQRLVLELAMARNSTEATLKVNLLMNKFSETAYSYIPFIQSEDHPQLSLLEVPGSRNEALDFLDDLDYDSKVLLLKQLAVDLGLGSSTKDITDYTRNISLSSEATMVDKIELLCLLSVRLSFIGLRFFGPICQLLYEKFRKNEILLLNNKNLSKLLTTLIRVMEGFEKKMASKQSKTSKTEAVRI